MSFIGVLKDMVGDDLSHKVLYEMSSYGPLQRFLRKHSGEFHCSEFFEDITPGDTKFKAQCQDVQALTFDDEVFDIVTSTEVFEHVPNDLKGFAEVCRTLKRGGYFVFIVPFYETPTVERAIYADGKITHLLEPEYHDDPLKADGCLCYRNYGPDIVDRLLSGGFEDARIIAGNDFTDWGYMRYVIVARKSMGIDPRSADTRPS
jgi:SAM-dependent methyltransferase